MMCWRDLSHECAEENCPMWMGSLDIEALDKDNEIGLNISKCAQVLREKVAFYGAMLELTDRSLDFDDEFIEDFFAGSIEDSREPKPSRSMELITAEKTGGTPGRKKGSGKKTDLASSSAGKIRDRGSVKKGSGQRILP
jgi:hypothetical protein